MLKDLRCFSPGLLYLKDIHPLRALIFILLAVILYGIEAVVCYKRADFLAF